jgi:hypothetical protein
MLSAAKWLVPYFQPLSSVFRLPQESRGRGVPSCNTSTPWRLGRRGKEKVGVGLRWSWVTIGHWKKTDWVVEGVVSKMVFLWLAAS